MKKLKFYRGVQKVTSFVLLGASPFILASCSKTTKTEDVSEEYSVEQGTRGINDLGVKRRSESTTNSSNKSIYGNVVSGNINPNNIVIGPNGDAYVDSKAASNASNAGKTTIDDKGGTLDTSGDKVREKETGYQIQDSNGDIKDQGNGGTPSGYSYDPERDAIVPDEDNGKYVYADSDYYDPNTGDLAVAKGVLVEKSRLQGLTKTKPQKDNSSNEVTTSPEVTYYEASDGSIFFDEEARDIYEASLHQNSTEEINDESDFVIVDGKLMTEEEKDKIASEYEAERQKAFGGR